MIDIWPENGSLASKRAATAAIVTGPILDLVLLPVLFIQTLFYFRSISRRTRSSPASKVTESLRASFKRVKRSTIWDRRALLVLLLLLMSIFKSVAALIQLLDIVSRPPTEWLYLLKTWPAATAPLGTAFIGVVVQTVYIHRLNSLLRVQTGRVFGSLWFRIAIAVFIGMIFLLTLASAIGLTCVAVTDQWSSFPKFATAHLFLTCVGDILITTLTIACINLAGHKAASLRVQSLMGRVVRFTAITAAIPSFLAFLSIILLPLPPSISRWHMVPNFALGKIYVCSLIWTFQYRQKLIDESMSPLHSNPRQVKGAAHHKPDLLDPEMDIRPVSHGGAFLNR
ncbi:hypothetical protein FS842_004481, partial [Serendipita sp. 407]